MSTFAGHSDLHALQADIGRALSSPPRSANRRPPLPLQHFEKACGRGRACYAPPPMSPCSWAHRAAVQFAAGPQSDASRRGVGEGAVVAEEFEVRLGLERLVVHAQPQVLRRRIRIDQLMRVEMVPGVPDRLEFAKARMSSGPNILGSNAPRDCPSPCSPESEPP